MGTETVASDTLPVYTSGEVPESLRTVTQLKAMRLKLAEGQQPAGWLSVYRRGHGCGRFPLYDPEGAARMRPLSAKQQRAMAARRTCPECGHTGEHVVWKRCADCQEKATRAARELRARTCHHCRRVSGAALAEDAYGWRACTPCRVRAVLRRQGEVDRRAAWEQTCPGRDCTVQTATAETVAAGRAASPSGWAPIWCPPCKERAEAERAEQARQEREARDRAVEERRLEVQALTGWARQALQEDVLILDTETTGLGDDARIVEISIITAGGRTVLDTLVNPGTPIPDEASDIHGITDSMVTGPGVPVFAEVLPALTEALKGRRCLIYNKPYDVGRLHHELTLHHQTAGHPEPGKAATTWLGDMAFEDAMIPYSNWCGEWSDYWGNYAWQPLHGGHRALGDCRAVVGCLRKMCGYDVDGDGLEDEGVTGAAVARWR